MSRAIRQWLLTERGVLGAAVRSLFRYRVPDASITFMRNSTYPSSAVAGESTCRFEKTAIVIRLGFRASVRIPLRSIERVESDAGVKLADEARITPGDPPNVLVRLKRPIVVRGLYGIRRRARVIRLYVDDPSLFIRRALEHR